MDPIITQKLIKDNAEDLNTYLRDLKNWETDIKKKDAELRGVDPDEARLYPEIRSKATKPKEADVSKSPDSEKLQKASKISGFDYGSWDKIDVDKVCEEIDSNEQKKMKEAAMHEKEMGNIFVQSKNWEKAIKCYTKAIKAYSEDARFFANRGLCYLKLKDFQKAESDCTQAITLDPEYVKAWLRRSAAWEGLGKIELAKRDLKKVLSLEQRNKEAISKLSALEKLSKDPKTKKSDGVDDSGEVGQAESPTVVESRSSEVSLDDEKELKRSSGDDRELPWKDYKGEVIKPVHKPPHLRSKKPLRRVPIREVVGGSGGPEGSSEKPSSASEIHEPSVRSSPPSVRVSSSSDFPQPEITVLPPVPKSSVQFLTDWKSVKSRTNMAVAYLKSIRPESLPSIFGNSLETTTLEEILNVMGHESWSVAPSEGLVVPEGHSTYGILKYLSCVPRFSTLAMFLESKEKTIIRELLAICVKNGECTTEEAADLGYKFML